MFISAGNTIQNKYAPDFTLVDLGQGQLLSWDKDKKAFVNVNVMDLDFQTPNGVDDIKIFEATGNGTQSLYVIPWHAVSEASLIVTINGVKQQDAAFTITAYDAYTNVQFSGPIPVGKSLEIIGLIVEDESSIKFATATATGAPMIMNLPWVAPGKESLFITIQGIKQQQAAYEITVIGDITQLSFNGVPDFTDIIEVVGITGNFGTTNYGVESVLGANLGFIGHGLYESATIAGKETTLNFKSLRAGNGMELISDGVSIMVAQLPDLVTNNINTVYTFVLEDAVKVMDNPTMTLCTVPHTTTLDFPIGHIIEIIQKDAVLTFTGEAGVTITSLNNSLTSAGIGSVVYLRKIANNEWILSGDIL